jgi:deazaflavin-dependent oxidoreductase (nitroreductase family)
MRWQSRIRKGFLVVLKHTLNPLTRRLAGTPFGPFALVRHVGRRSGKSYATPLLARRVEGGFVIELTYGPQVDWYQNVLVAGGCTLVWHGRAYPVDGIETLDTETGRAAFNLPQRLVLRALRRTHYRKLVLQTSNGHSH